MEHLKEDGRMKRSGFFPISSVVLAGALMCTSVGTASEPAPDEDSLKDAYKAGDSFSPYEGTSIHRQSSMQMSITP